MIWMLFGTGMNEFGVGMRGNIYEAVDLTDWLRVWRSRLIYESVVLEYELVSLMVPDHFLWKLL